ncbi:MAG: transposase, partial [Candidatus Hydrothermarchaeota archaeon]
EAWKSYFALLKLKQKGKLPPHINQIKPPGYWKNRRTGKRILRILIRNDCYSLSDVLKLPFGLKIRWKGKNRWRGKQGRLEIVYDDLSKSWYAFQPVEVQPLHQPIGNKKAYCDLGVVNLITAWIEGDKRATIYSGRTLLADWWYWTKKIAEHQSELKETNDKHASKRLRKLYRKRKRRFRHAVNTIVSRFVEDCYEKRVSDIIIGDLTGIRNNNSKGKKTNSMIHNFWSHRYLVERIKTTSENYGIKVIARNEAYTSLTCSLCGKRHKNGRRHRGLYICKTYNKAMNADVNAVANIAGDDIPEPYGRDNWVVAHPSVVKVQPRTSHASA